MNDRPRIYFRGGQWCCGDRKENDQYWAVGFGTTQHEAYENWKRTARYAFPKQRAQ